MNALVRLEQGSAEWLAHRKLHRNASETPAVMGVSPWVTPYQLWLQRTGRATQEVTKPMLRGTALEPAARAAYEALTGHLMQPVVLVDGDYSASLDGMTLDGQLVLEIKVPFKGASSALWQEAEVGRIPVHYQWQLQHQLMVAKAELAHLFVFDGDRGLLLEARPQPDDWVQLRDHWDAFMRCVQEDVAPGLAEGDTRLREDEAWTKAASAYLKAKREADAASAELDQAKGALLKLTAGPMERGGGVQVTRYWKTGSVDYKKVPALAGVDLSPYRSPSREEVRITICK